MVGSVRGSRFEWPFWRRGDAQPPKFSYKAFISYKHHVSTSFALQLEQALKAYAKPLFTRPIRIFRDEKHLAPSVDLPRLIVDALDASEFLILLASPEAAGSPWVRHEVDHWCGELRRTQNLIVVLTAGEIATDDEAKQIDWTHTNALPTVLEAYLERVPLYVDLRGNDHVDALSLANPDFKTAVNSITARFRGVDPNDMLGEEIHQHRWNLRIRNGAITALAVLTLVSVITAVVAVEQREEARQQTRIAVSRQYAAEAATLIEKDLDEAILLAVKAVTTEETFEARNILFQALSQSTKIEAFLYRMRTDERKQPTAYFDKSGDQVALAADTFHLFDLTEAAGVTSRKISPRINNVSTLVYTSVGSTIALGGDDGYISLLSTSQWTPITPPVKVSDHPITRLFFNAKDDRLFAVSDGQLFSLSVSSGKLSLDEHVQIRDPRQDPASDITANSADGRLLVTGYGTTVVVWDLSGPIRQQLSFDVHTVRFTVGLVELAFSSDGKTLAVDLMAGSDGIPVNFVQLYTIVEPDVISETPPILQYTFMTQKSLSNPRLAFNNVGDHLLIGDRDATFEFIELNQSNSQGENEINLTASNKFAIKVKGLSGPVHDARYSLRDDRLLLGVGTHIVLWNPRSPQKLSRTLVAHDHEPKSLTFSNDGGMLILAAVDGSVYRWNTKNTDFCGRGESAFIEGYANRARA